MRRGEGPMSGCHYTLSPMPNVRSQEQSAYFQMRLSPQERAALDRVASERGVAISAVIREAVRPVLQPHIEQGN